MEDPRPSLVVRGFDSHKPEEAKNPPLFYALLSYLSHVNRDMLLVWFVGAILTKVKLHNSYQPESYNLVINGVIVLCALKFVVILVRIFTKAWERSTIFKLIGYIDYAILVGWGLLFIVGEFLRLGHHRITDTGHMIDTLFITVFRHWCYIFTFILFLFVLYHYVSKWWESRHYHPQFDVTLH